MLVKLLRALLGKVAGGGTCGSLWRACFFGTQLAVDKKREPHYLHGTYAPIEIISDYRYLLVLLAGHLTVPFYHLCHPHYHGIHLLVDCLLTDTFPPSDYQGL